MAENAKARLPTVVRLKDGSYRLVAQMIAVSIEMERQ